MLVKFVQNTREIVVDFHKRRVMGSVPEDNCHTVSVKNHANLRHVAITAATLWTSRRVGDSICHMIRCGASHHELTPMISMVPAGSLYPTERPYTDYDTGPTEIMSTVQQVVEIDGLLIQLDRTNRSSMKAIDLKATATALYLETAENIVRGRNTHSDVLRLCIVSMAAATDERWCLGELMSLCGSIITRLSLEIDFLAFYKDPKPGKIEEPSMTDLENELWGPDGGKPRSTLEFTSRQANCMLQFVLRDNQITTINQTTMPEYWCHNGRYHRTVVVAAVGHKGLISWVHTGQELILPKEFGELEPMEQCYRCKKYAPLATNTECQDCAPCTDCGTYYNVVGGYCGPCGRMETPWT